MCTIFSSLLTIYFLAGDPYIMMVVVHDRQPENIPLKNPKTVVNVDHS
jgi:hypothetical protein